MLLASYLAGRLLENLIFIILWLTVGASLFRKKWFFASLFFAILAMSLFGNFSSGNLNAEEVVWNSISILIGFSLAFLTRPSKRVG